MIQGSSQPLSSTPCVEDCRHFTWCSLYITTSKKSSTVLQLTFPFQTSISLLWKNIISLTVSHSVTMLKTVSFRLDHTKGFLRKPNSFCIKMICFLRFRLLLFCFLSLCSNILQVNTLFFKFTQFEEFKASRWKYLHKITEKCSNTVNEFQELLKVTWY